MRPLSCVFCPLSSFNHVEHVERAGNLRHAFQPSWNLLPCRWTVKDDAALRATTNPGASKDRRRRSGGDLPPPGLRLPPSRDALRSRLAGAGASPPPFRASSPCRDTNAAFAAHETSRNPHPRRILNTAFAAKAACGRIVCVALFVREAREAGVFRPPAWRNSASCFS